MTTDTPSPIPAEGEAGASRFQLRALVLAGVAFSAGIWLTGRLEQRTDQAFPGRLQARVVTISAEGSARLQQILVKPGERVSAGDPLFILASEQRSSDLQLHKQEAAKREQDVVRIKAAADLELHWRRREIQSEIFQTQFKLAHLRHEKLHLDVEQVAWREQLSVQTVFAGEHESPPSVFRFINDAARNVPDKRVETMLKEDAAAMASNALGSQITLCERRLEELRTLNQNLEEQIRSAHGVDAAEEQCKLTAAALAAEEEVPTSTTVNSPSYGVMGLFHKQAGDQVGTGELLVQILDDDKRTIEVEVPSWAVIRFAPGKRIRLEFPGAERRTGVISSIPPQTSASPVDANDDASVRLVIEPAGKLWPQAPIGSRVLVYQP